jgi:hypothetical protein
VDQSLLPRTLTWDEVDPGTHPFDADSAPHVIRVLAAERNNGEAAVLTWVSINDGIGVLP